MHTKIIVCIEGETSSNLRMNSMGGELLTREKDLVFTFV